jgi:hypothetical protein
MLGSSGTALFFNLFSIIFLKGIDFIINFATGGGVKNCPDFCFNQVVKSLSKKLLKCCCFQGYLI